MKKEIFTPLSIVKQMNEACDNMQVTKNNWQEYVALLKLEITCGEAPFIVSRYDPVSDSQELLPIADRVYIFFVYISLKNKNLTPLGSSFLPYLNKKYYSF